MQQPRPSLLVLPGWDDNGKDQYNALKTVLSQHAWSCSRADLPDSSWSDEKRKSVTRDDSLRQAAEDLQRLTGSTRLAPTALLGFSYGGYIGALLSALHPVDLLVLRSPALYPDDDWFHPKEDLDRRDLAKYRQEIHTPATNKALKACSEFRGHVLMVDSGCDEIIPTQVVQSYLRAFDQASSVSRYTLAGADHELSQASWKDAYHAQTVAWLNLQAGVNDPDTWERALPPLAGTGTLHP